jgi:hypothetical protein
MRARGVTLIALAALAIAGCGGSRHAATPASGPSSARDAVAQTIRGYFAAVTAGRANDTCASFTPSSREKLAEFGHEQLGLAHGSCARTLRAFFTNSASRQVRSGGAHEVSNIAIHGARATARVNGVERAMKLELVGGRWLIDSEPTGETD